MKIIMLILGIVLVSGVFVEGLPSGWEEGVVSWGDEVRYVVEGIEVDEDIFLLAVQWQLENPTIKFYNVTEPWINVCDKDEDPVLNNCILIENIIWNPAKGKSYDKCYYGKPFFEEYSGNYYRWTECAPGMSSIERVVPIGVSRNLLDPTVTIGRVQTVCDIDGCRDEYAPSERNGDFRVYVVDFGEVNESEWGVKIQSQLRSTRPIIYIEYEDVENE